MKYILHIDMNSFFASCEEINHPEYQGKPLAVSGKTKRSVVCSANYLARGFGVKAAMPIYMAQKLCRSLMIVVPHFELYHHYSNLFMDVIRTHFTNIIEIGSIDECYADITSLVNDKNDPISIAKKIQMAIKRKTGLSCSIGVANNKFLAKMGSEYKKPMGITTMWRNELPKKIWPQAIENMHWIGKSTAQLLRKNGINTIGDLAQNKNIPLLKKILDKNWMIHYEHANGIGSDEIDLSHNTPKSIGTSETFLNDTNDFDEIKEKLIELTRDSFNRLQRHELQCKTLSVSIKTTDFKLHTKSLTLTKYINDFEEILVKIIALYQTHFANRLIRLVGVSFSNLSDNHQIEFTSELFDDYCKNENKETASNPINEIIKKINDKFARNIIDTAKRKID